MFIPQYIKCKYRITKLTLTRVSQTRIADAGVRSKTAIFNYYFVKANGCFR